MPPLDPAGTTTRPVNVLPAWLAGVYPKALVTSPLTRVDDPELPVYPIPVLPV